MAQVISFFILLGFLVLGVLTHRFGFTPGTKLVDKLLMFSLGALLFGMGLRIGMEEGILENLVSIGFTALAFALANVTGTVLVLWLLYFLLRKADTETAEEQAVEYVGMTDHLKEPFLFLCIIIAGILIGLFLNTRVDLNISAITSVLLYFLLYVIGIQFSQNGINPKTVLAHPDTLLIPIGTIVGTLVGGALLSLVHPLGLGKSLALSSGFGWYSLSGVLIADLGDPVTGSAAFLSNMMRETIALLTIPLISRTAYPYVSIGIGGATSMDVTLPIIERSCGPSSVPLSIASGAILSVFVPVLVPLFYAIPW
ncbi:MAG: lysine exporter LysO family protein [Spirochaetia bacterium]